MEQVRHVSTYHLIVFALVSLVLLMTGLFYAVYTDGQSGVAQPEVVAGSVRMTGKIVCLPHKDQNGPQTMECAYGLQAADGTYYGLQDLHQQDLMSGKLSPGTKVVLQGDLQPAKSDETYAVAGNITVKSLE